MEKHFLHVKYPELQKSKEVNSAVEKKEREEEISVPNDPNERVEAYLQRLEKLALDPEKGQKRIKINSESRPRALSLLREMVMNEYVRSNKEKMAEGAARVEERAARELGIGAEYNEEGLEQRGDIAVADLEKSLDNWIMYLSDMNEPYPVWFRYYAFRNILDLGDFDKDKGEFTKRSKGSTRLFPDVDRGALAYVEQMIEASRDENILSRLQKAQRELANNDLPNEQLITKEKAQIFAKLPFSKQYAEGIKQAGEITPEMREEIRGKWIKYQQNTDPTALWASLQNKGAPWCTKGFATAETQLKGGDFYVYYTLDKQGRPTIPRIAIRMNGDKQIGEVRGVSDSQQNVEGDMTPILEEKLKEFGPEAEKYKKKVEDMRRMTKIEKKHKSNEPLTKEDLTFLYEIDSSIEGFGYDKDPRIEEIRNQRNSREDYAIVFECKEDQIVVGNPNLINEDTKVFSFGEGNIDYKVLSKLSPNVKVYAELPNKPIEFIRPQDLDYKKLSEERSGRQTQILNPESKNIDLENAKIFIPNLDKFIGKPKYEVLQYITKTYGDKYYLPGLEMRQYIFDNPDKFPKLKDGNFYFFPGSIFRGSSGYWYVSFCSWIWGGWSRNDNWLDIGWSSHCRLVLLEI